MAPTLVERSRRALAREVQQRVAGDDAQGAHARIFDSVGPRWFAEPDPIWRVHADPAMFVGGIRALLLQSLHPVAMLAVSRHSGFRGDPWGRLQRTSAFLASTTYGTIADAERDIARVRSIHTRVRGTTAEGLPYRADDPELLTWIHLAEVDSFLRTYQHLGARRLSDADADTYVAQSALVAERLGVPDPPHDVAGLRTALEGFRPLLRMTSEAEEAAALVLRDPPLGGLSRVGYAALAVGAVSTLPAWARAMLRLPTLPLTDRLVARPLARSGLGAIRWALAGPGAA